jgi:hypothetical protein
MVVPLCALIARQRIYMTFQKNEFVYVANAFEFVA